MEIFRDLLEAWDSIPGLISQDEILETHGDGKCSELGEEIWRERLLNDLSARLRELRMKRPDVFKFNPRIVSSIPGHGGFMLGMAKGIGARPLKFKELKKPGRPNSGLRDLLLMDYTFRERDFKTAVMSLNRNSRVLSVIPVVVVAINRGPRTHTVTALGYHEGPFAILALAQAREE